MTKKMRKEVLEIMDNYAVRMKIEAARQIRCELDNILTNGTIQAINDKIKHTMAENYVIDIAIGLKKK